MHSRFERLFAGAALVAISLWTTGIIFHQHVVLTGREEGRLYVIRRIHRRTDGLYQVMFGSHRGTNEPENAYDSRSSIATDEKNRQPAKPEVEETLPRQLLCLIGTAASTERALSAHNQWGAQFPSFWITRIGSIVESQNNLFHVYSSAPNTSWLGAIGSVLHKARRRFRCEYFFTLSDQYSFQWVGKDPPGPSSKSPGDQLVGFTLAKVLNEILLVYQPGVAGFSWEKGDARMDSMHRLAEKFGHASVAPLTGFDATIAIYHYSLIDFFIPPPSFHVSEAWHQGLSDHLEEYLQHTTLEESFLDVAGLLSLLLVEAFAAILLKENAIRINAIAATSEIESAFDMTAVDTAANIERSSGRSFLDMFTQMVGRSLHSGQSDFGRYLNLKDVSWNVRRGHAQYSSSFLIDRLEEVLGNSVSFNDSQSLPLILLDRLSPKVTSDRCTMVLTVFDRISLIQERLQFYHTLKILAAIVVIWNNPKAPPPEDVTSRSYDIPVYFLQQSKNSLNNRFIPQEKIVTDCIINMDDDWNIPHHHLEYAASIWKDQFTFSLVGFKHQGRLHLDKTGDQAATSRQGGVWGYSRDVRRQKRVSIVLPTGMIYHRKYLEYYAKLPTWAHEWVDQTMNCDDILFNMMVSNITGSCPVVVDAVARSVDIGGLWKDRRHFTERNVCLNLFTEKLFDGKMPLRYTITAFKLGHKPKQDDLRCIDSGVAG
ncbi:glycosyl transferase family 64 domain-containing protein [Cladochytrium replicatum]|nr:glycosyl transferase family 64 domain-containing protein [Cladochytrium replicatum]